MNQIDARADLTERLLQENYAYWIAKFNYGETPPRHQAAIAMLIPATHTFGYVKDWGTGRRFPYRDILFEQRGLLADQMRHEQGLYMPGEPRPMVAENEAGKVKLDHFVFAYLGVHDPWYTHAKFDPIPPFGIFLNTELESFPYCNATRRDLASPEAETPPNREFLLPNDGRRFTSFQAHHDFRHGGDFWHYWGASKYVASQPKYCEISWKWKIEFHYRNSVPVEKFAAILWPSEFRAVSPGGRERRALGDDTAFKHANPHCRVIPYLWNSGEPILSFIRSSEAVARYFVAVGEYPVDAEDASEAMRHEL